MSASSVLLSGKTHNAVVCELLQAACSECAWSGRQTLQNGAINVRSSSSKRAHQGIWNDYIEVCALTGVDPKQLSVSTAAHVAKLYFFRTKQLALSLSVSNHTSAEMTSFFMSLDHQGRWTTEICTIGEKPVREAINTICKVHQELRETRVSTLFWHWGRIFSFGVREVGICFARSMPPTEVASRCGPTCQ